MTWLKCLHYIDVCTCYCQTGFHCTYCRSTALVTVTLAITVLTCWSILLGHQCLVNTSTKIMTWLLLMCTYNDVMKLNHDVYEAKLLWHAHFLFFHWYLVLVASTEGSHLPSVLARFSLACVGVPRLTRGSFTQRNLSSWQEPRTSHRASFGIKALSLHSVWSSGNFLSLRGGSIALFRGRKGNLKATTAQRNSYAPHWIYNAEMI
jgi:hypothetical protein